MMAQPQTQTIQQVTAKAPAMVELATQVGQANEYGNSDLLSLKLGVNRWDEVTIEALESQQVFISFEDGYQTPIEYAEIPQKDMASIFRMVEELRTYLNRPKSISGVDITVQKHIPFETQLGSHGASAAAVMVALTKLWDVSISREELVQLAQRVDTGIAEALTGGALIRHHTAAEDLITPVLMQHEVAMVLVPAAADIETHEMFQELIRLSTDQDTQQDRSSLSFAPELLQALSHGEAENFALLMHNDFQSALVSFLPDHHDWLTAGMDEGALAAQTIAHGASLVFICQDLDHATELAERFEDRMGITALAHTGPVAGAQLL